MLYEFPVTVSKNTPAHLPLKVTARLSAGRIVHASIQFPDGCRGLVHAQVWQGLHILWPSNPDVDFCGDGVVIPWAEEMDLEAEPFELTLVLWNEDDAYAHTVTFRVNVIPPAAVEEATGWGRLLRRMATVLGVK